MSLRKRKHLSARPGRLTPPERRYLLGTIE